MRNLLRPFLLMIALALAGCVQGPTFGEVAATLPPPPPGNARIYVYRLLEPYVTTSWTTVSFNGREVGASAPGTVFYRDVPPGQYLVSCISRGIYPNQFKTVTLAPGDNVYIRIDDIDTWAETKFGYFNTYVVSVVDPRFAAAQIRGLAYSRD